MNSIIESNKRVAHYPKGLIRRMFSSVVTIFGGLVLILAAASLVNEFLVTWSPTATARNCFRYPDETTLPDSEAITQFMLSEAFFGNDALYFDLGDENSGTSILPHLQPSKNLVGEKPQKSIGEPEDFIPDGYDIYYYDFSKLPAGELGLIPLDLSRNAKPGEILLSNNTNYKIDAASYLDRKFPSKLNLKTSTLKSNEPLVLILHTHGTEAFSPEGEISCKPNTVLRSSDTRNNIVAVGAVMAEKLNEAGIPTIHCEIMHDLNSYTDSYNLAADTIQRYLAEYPSIKYVFDVHRDAISYASGDLVKPLCVINNKLAAQVMLLVGTNEKGADHPNWEDNMTVAVYLQNLLTNRYKNFARPINVRGASFNEQFTPGSLLIEIGSAANTISEAKYAAIHLTYSIIDMIKESIK
jgi:stage II sporulation protein P